MTTVKVPKGSPIAKPSPPATVTTHVGGQQAPTCELIVSLQTRGI